MGGWVGGGGGGGDVTLSHAGRREVPGKCPSGRLIDQDGKESWQLCYIIDAKL